MKPRGRHFLPGRRPRQERGLIQTRARGFEVCRAPLPQGAEGVGAPRNPSLTCARRRSGPTCQQRGREPGAVRAAESFGSECDPELTGRPWARVPSGGSARPPVTESRLSRVPPHTHTSRAGPRGRGSSEWRSLRRCLVPPVDRCVAVLSGPGSSWWAWRGVAWSAVLWWHQRSRLVRSGRPRLSGAPASLPRTLHVRTFCRASRSKTCPCTLASRSSRCLVAPVGTVAQGGSSQGHRARKPRTPTTGTGPPERGARAGARCRGGAFPGSDAAPRPRRQPRGAPDSCPPGCCVP